MSSSTTKRAIRELQEGQVIYVASTAKSVNSLTEKVLLTESRLPVVDEKLEEDRRRIISLEEKNADLQKELLKMQKEMAALQFQVSALSNILKGNTR